MLSLQVALLPSLVATAQQQAVIVTPEWEGEPPGAGGQGSTHQAAAGSVLSDSASRQGRECSEDVEKEAAARGQALLLTPSQVC